ncbi:TetR/AcrR family transcriptional regulator [Saccharibacillus sacchari]|uniref:TetR/AcrR family transcriptional regulator n=1 Tax=Saccharibacillus sacchari TaxID=456493 RepID=UPI0004AF1D26|nr:TetR/AcrR family transcriptional regulator [Saccharibacillus sacchari]
MEKEQMPAKQAKLNAILDAATSLLVERPTASLNEIATRAGIGIATLHRYIESREQLMLHLGFRAMDVLRKAFESVEKDAVNPERYIPRLIETLIPLGDRIYFLTRDATIDGNPDMEHTYRDIRQPVLEKIELLQQQRILRQDCDAEWIWSVTESVLFLAWERMAGGNLTPSEAAALVESTVRRGFGAGERQS